MSADYAKQIHSAEINGGLLRADQPPPAKSTTQIAIAIMLAISIIIICWTQFATGKGTVTEPLLPLAGKVEAWAAVTIAISIQALPFLVLGSFISAAIAAFAPSGFLTRLTPRNPFFGVPIASATAIALPGCECASVPVAQSFMRAGVPKSAAVVFMLASPALNPVVIVSTAIAFYGIPQMVWARFIASFLAVVIAGWIWIIIGEDDMIQVQDARSGQAGGGCHSHQSDRTTGKQWRLETFSNTALHDLTHAGGFLVLGAILAGLVKVAVPASWFISVSSTPVLMIVLMALFAITLSLCSEADAFVAASFTAVSPTAQLVFLVVGPVIDVKILSMQIASFGSTFVRTFMPIVLACSVLSATLVGMLIFGTL